MRIVEKDTENRPGPKSSWSILLFTECTLAQGDSANSESYSNKNSYWHTDFPYHPKLENVIESKLQ